MPPLRGKIQLSHLMVTKDYIEEPQPNWNIHTAWVPWRKFYLIEWFWTPKNSPLEYNLEEFKSRFESRLI